MKRERERERERVDDDLLTEADGDGECDDCWDVCSPRLKQSFPVWTLTTNESGTHACLPSLPYVEHSSITISLSVISLQLLLKS